MPHIEAWVAEGLSNALVEAMANSLPVFATNVGGISEIIEDGITGFLLPPFSPQDWTEKLIQACDTALMRQTRTVAHERAKQFFSAERHASAFLTFYENAVNSKVRCTE